MAILTIILVIAVFLAIIGLGLDTFIGGIIKGVDKLGITNMVSNITDDADNVIQKADHLIQNLTRGGANTITNPR